MDPLFATALHAVTVEVEVEGEPVIVDLREDTSVGIDERRVQADGAHSCRCWPREASSARAFWLAISSIVYRTWDPRRQ